METKDIVQEYAQETKPAEVQATAVESTQESSLTEAQESVAPESASNQSAYEALLSGKSNIQEQTQEVSQDVVEPTITEPQQADIQTTLEVTPLDSSDATDEVVDEDDFISAKTEGKFQSWEEVVEALNKPAVPQFENELSAQVYNMIVEGKVDELIEVLGAKKFAEDVKEMADEDVIKSYIKANNPDFDDDDVEAEYSENYTIDEYQFDESKVRREQKKISQRIRSDAQEAREFFESLAQDIKLPELSRQVETPVEEDNETDALIQEQRSKFLSSLDGVEARVSSLPFQWRDEKANIAVNGKFDIPAQELSKYRQAAEDLESYQVNRYYKDGQYLTDKMVREMYIADNFDKIMTSAISQAVNQTRLEMLKQSKNIQSELEPSGTFKPNAADEERAMLDKLFMGHLQRQQ